MRLHIFIFIFFLLFAELVSGSPAKRDKMILTQPDGSTFTAIFKGDEFIRIKTTTDGHAIMQNEEGWWCYATYDNGGNRICTDIKVGDTTSGNIPSESQEIPYRLLSQKAKSLRTDLALMEETGLTMCSTDSETRTLSGAKHGLVILAEFQDVRFLHSKNDFDAMLNQSGYNLNGAVGSAREYFDDQFQGVIEFDFRVSGIVTLRGKREYYGANNSSGNDSRPAEMIIEACKLADDQIDFSLYDDDSDGIVDNVFVIFAGEDEAEGADEDCIWSHSWYIRSGAQKTLQLDGCMIDRYACTSEITRIYDEDGILEDTRLCSIGTFCHEYCHTFGLPDMYDTDYDNEDGWAAGLWNTTSIMDAGNQNNHGNTPPNFNAIERYLLGISEPGTIEEDGVYSMSPINVDGEYYMMETDADGEYYLFECRSTQQKWDAHIGGSGMLVYHIDRKEDVIDKWTTANTVNSNASHQCADLVEADGRRDNYSGPDDYLAKKGNTKGIFFPYDDINSLPSSGNPGLNFWSGEEGRLSITGIRWNEDKGIDFSVIGNSDQTTPPSIRNSMDYDSFSDGAIILFQSTRDYEGEATVAYGLTGEDTTMVSIRPYEPGKYAIYLSDLQPSATYTVTASIRINELEGKSRSITFMTKKAPTFNWPYMHFGKARRNTNGTFLHDSRIPLKVINAQDAVEIRWTFNDQEIRTDGDHYYSLTGDGVLKAHITWKDGSEDVVVKEITIAPLMVQ